MMNIQINTSELVRSEKRLREKGSSVAKVIQTIITKSALIVERYGKLYSPVLTGRMRASITPIDITESSAAVAPQVEYAKYVHRRVPFMFAAKESALPDIQKVATDEINNAIK